MKKKCIVHIGMHKTGSSSIQESLSQIRTTEMFHYVKLGSPNHSGAIYTLFSEQPEQYHAWRKQGLTVEEVQLKREKIEEQLVGDISNGDSEIFLISGEDITELSQNALQKFKDFLSKYFQTVEVFAYVRPPKSYIESAFQQSIKGYLKTFSLEKMYPNYRERFEKFDAAFGRENVQLHLFDVKKLVNEDVVTDFCQKNDIEIDAATITRTNDSLSREAVSLLYAYRKYGPGYGSGKYVMQENNSMILQLAKIGQTKFRFSNELIGPILEKHHADLEWIETRLGVPFAVENQPNENDAVKSEADLLRLKGDAVKALRQLVSTKYLPVGLKGRKMSDVVMTVHLLRLKEKERSEQHRQGPLTSVKRKDLRAREQVMVGKKGYLFLAGGSHQTLKFFRGELRPSSMSVQQFFENIKSRKAHCLDMGIAYRHYVFPDKLYAERVNINIPIESLYKSAYGAVETLEDVHYFDFDSETGNAYFYKTDTHMNIYGVLETLKAMVESEEDFNTVLPAMEQNLDVKIGFVGDLGVKMPVEHAESTVMLNLPKGATRVHNGIEFGNTGIIDIVHNDNALYDSRLLIFGDSFFRTLLLNALAYFYKEIIFCRTAFMHREVVTSFNPDVVFTGNAERYLSNVESDERASDFFLIPKERGLRVSPSKEFDTLFEKMSGETYNKLREEGAFFETNSFNNDEYKIAVGAIFKNEYEYVLEWVSWYLNAGFDCIYIADNFSSDGTTALLEALEDIGVVKMLYQPPLEKSAQLAAYNQIVELARKDGVDAILFVDADEFLVHDPFQKGGEAKLLKKLLQPENVGSVGIYWRCFGSSNLLEKGSDPVVERFTKCADDETRRHNKIIKSITQLDAIKSVHVHFCTLKDGYIKVDAQGNEIKNYVNMVEGQLRPVESFSGKTENLTKSPLRLHHYMVKSEEEYVTKKLNRGDAMFSSDQYQRGMRYFEIHDFGDETVKFSSEQINTLKQSMDALQKKIVSETNYSKALQGSVTLKDGWITGKILSEESQCKEIKVNIFVDKVLKKTFAVDSKIDADRSRQEIDVIPTCCFEYQLSTDFSGSIEIHVRSNNLHFNLSEEMGKGMGKKVSVQKGVIKEKMQTALLDILHNVRENRAYSSADLLRDMALYYETEVLESHPDGPYIKQKTTEYSARKFKSFIMIVTYQRSGSTLLQSILNSSDECVIRGENYNLLYFAFQSYLATEDAMKHIQQGGVTAVDWPFFGAEHMKKEQYFCSVVSAFIEDILNVEPKNSKMNIGFKEVKYDEFGENLPRFLDLMKKCVPNLKIVFNFRNLDDVSKSAWNARRKKEILVTALSNFEALAESYTEEHKGFAKIIKYDDYLEDTQILADLSAFLDISYDALKVKSILAKKLNHGKK